MKLKMDNARAQEKKKKDCAGSDVSNTSQTMEYDWSR